MVKYSSYNDYLSYFSYYFRLQEIHIKIVDYKYTKNLI
jgi:hypothetical protein